MIYDQHGLKFRYYLRRLTQAESVATVYSWYHEVEKLQEVEENNIAREQRRWHCNWGNDLPAHSNAIDNRKVIEYRKLQNSDKTFFRQQWLKRHSDKTFFGPWPKPSP